MGVGRYGCEWHRDSRKWHGIWQSRIGIVGDGRGVSYAEHGYGLESLSRDDGDHFHLAEEGDLGWYEARREWEGHVFSIFLFELCSTRNKELVGALTRFEGRDVGYILAWSILAG